jgi:tetratricopeptide (TPR) repeat protein
MKYAGIIVSLFVCLATQPGAQASTGDAKAWKRYQSAGEKALKAKDSLEAERQFTLAVAEAEKIRKGEGKLRESLNDLAPLLVNHRKYEQAQGAFERLRALYVEDLGSNHIRVAECLVGLGHAYTYNKKLSEAEAAFLEARRIIDRKSLEYNLARMEHHPAMIEVRNGLAFVYAQQGRHAEAEALYRFAIESAERPRVEYRRWANGRVRVIRYEPPYGLLAGLSNDLGSLLATQHRWAEAEESFKQAQRMFQTGFGKGSSGVALSLANLGHAYVKQSRFDEAEETLTRALAVREKVFASNHPIIADTLEMLADVQSRRDPELAKATLKRAQQIRAAGAAQ